MGVHAGEEAVSRLASNCKSGAPAGQCEATCGKGSGGGAGLLATQDGMLAFSSKLATDATSQERATDDDRRRYIYPRHTPPLSSPLWRSSRALCCGSWSRRCCLRSKAQVRVAALGQLLPRASNTGALFLTAETALSHTKIGSMVLGEVHSLLADADPTSFLLLKNKAEWYDAAGRFCA